ncbi:MAG: hypothetical protein Q7S39_12850 [Ignavibacteria bacterium]|nr:hypothetical protein [Ignavibacteria bacterium]
MVRYIKIFLLLIFVLIWYSSASAQGTLFTREAANQKFGPVLKSIDLPVNTLLSFTNQTSNHLMFRIQDNQVVILDERRNVLYPAGMQVNSQDVFTVFSVSIINELLSNGSGVLVSIEQRKDVLSISYGQLTMEVGTLCPPVCN